MDNTQVFRLLFALYVSFTYALGTTVHDSEFHIGESKYRQYSKPIKVPSIVYGKAAPVKHTKNYYVPPSPKPKAVVKFKPSQEDSGYDVEYAQNYKQSQADLSKYIQQYANQVFTAQKHANQLSDAQKHVLAQNYASSKHKFIPITTSAPETKFAEKYPAYLYAHPTKQAKKTYDTIHQSTDSKTLYATSETQEENKGWSAYEPYQSYGKYGVIAPEKVAELPKITGFKIPISIANHNSDTKEISKDNHHNEHEHQEYPHHEPKYEYMYQVHDPHKHNSFGHAEARKGKDTYGKYYVQLPDGRLETVKYYVDKHGYHAEVDFKGEAKHPPPTKHTPQHYEESQGEAIKGYKTEDISHLASYGIEE